MNAKNSNEQTVIRFIEACNDFDFEKMQQCLADNVVAYISNADAELDKVVGAKAYMQRYRDMNREDVELKLNIPQIVTLASGQVLVMVEIKVSRHENMMHNHAAFLITVIDQKITEMTMVDALPKTSDEFWQ